LSVVALVGAAAATTFGCADAGPGDGTGAAVEEIAAGGWVHVPAWISGAGVFVELELDGRAGYFHVDTASWFSFVYPSARSGITAGRHRVRWGSGKNVVDVGHKAFIALDASAPSDASAWGGPRGARVVGTAGNNLFAGYRIAFDPRRSEILLAKDDRPSAPPIADLRTPTVVHGEHLLARDGLDENGILVFPCAFDARPAVTCMFDSGAPPPPTVIGALARGMSYASTRSVPAISADFSGHRLDGAYHLTAAMKLGGQTVTRQQPVLAFDRFAVLEDEAKHFQRNIVGLVGVFNQFVTVVDMRRATLSFYALPGRRTTERDYFDGYGVIGVASTAQGATVRVVRGSVAEREGVRDGDVWTGVAGTPHFSPVGIVLDAPGTTRRFEFSRNGKTIDLLLTAEDLLR
jgi:hypothetical protein